MQEAEGRVYVHLLTSSLAMLLMIKVYLLKRD